MNLTLLETAVIGSSGSDTHDLQLSLRIFEYMLQSLESSWGFPSNLQTILNLLLVNVKRSSAEQIKTK